VISGSRKLTPYGNRLRPSLLILLKSHLEDLDVELLCKDFAVDEADREALTSGAYDAAHEFASAYDFSSLAKYENNDSPRNM
jgi:hypothetical protein